jgi:hypothetical protein
MSNTNDNFGPLWANFREQVAQARTKREAVYTFDEGPSTQQFGGRVSLAGDIDTHHGRPYITLSVGRGSWGGPMTCRKSDLIAIAAQCMAVAEEMEKAEPTPVHFDAMAHGHLITERAPSDDEQP